MYSKGDPSLANEVAESKKESEEQGARCEKERQARRDNEWYKENRGRC